MVPLLLPTEVVKREPMSQAPKLTTRIYEGYEADQRLRKLGGLTMAILVEIILKGEYARAEHTLHDPMNAGGLDAYRYRVRSIRDALCPQAWTIDRTGGVEATRSPAGDHVILTRGGNEDVGRRNGFPQPRSIVGESTRGVVAKGKNGSMLFDPDWLNMPATSPANDASFATWMLLVYRDGDVVQAEMSWPNEFNDDDGLVNGWIERILVADINMADPTDRSGDQPVEPPVVIDVPLLRKR